MIEVKKDHQFFTTFQFFQREFLSFSLPKNQDFLFELFQDISRSRFNQNVLFLEIDFYYLKICPSAKAALKYWVWVRYLTWYWISIRRWHVVYVTSSKRLQKRGLFHISTKTSKPGPADSRKKIVRGIFGILETPSIHYMPYQGPGLPLKASNWGP